MIEMTPEEKFDFFSSGQFLLIDKPITWTSFDVVNYIRKIVSPKKFKTKVGHAGTLDPLASGLLILCTGKKTKEIDTFAVKAKQYIATIKIGSTTPSYDLETEENNFFDVANITDELIMETASQFLGSTFQSPPLYSAIRVDGERAYFKARRGEELEMKSKEIIIEQFAISSITRGEKYIEVIATIDCSKGTYIRSIANDFGKKLNSGAHLSALVRTKIGEYDLQNAMTIADFKAKYSNDKTVETQQ